jgi:uncharacterized protein YuzE
MKITYDSSSDAAYIEFDPEGDEDLEYDHIEGGWPINVELVRVARSWVLKLWTQVRL